MAVRLLKKTVDDTKFWILRLVRFGRLCMLVAIDVRLEQLRFRRINVDDICP